MYPWQEYPTARTGLGYPNQDREGVPPSQDRTGVLPVRTGLGYPITRTELGYPWPGQGYPWPPPPPRDRTVERVLAVWLVASCSHTGGLSCLIRKLLLKLIAWNIAFDLIGFKFLTMCYWILKDVLHSSFVLTFRYLYSDHVFWVIHHLSEKLAYVLNFMRNYYFIFFNEEIYM